MKTTTSTVAIATMLAISGMLPAKVDAAARACYQWDLFPGHFLKLGVKPQRRISTDGEEAEFGHARQNAQAVNGTIVGWCGPGTMAAVTGTVILASPLANTVGETGAHMGLTIHALRGDGVEAFCREGLFDCTSSEVNDTPGAWNCESINGFDFYHGFSTLIKVLPIDNEPCGFFQDGGDGLGVGAATTAPGPGGAGGLKP